MGRGGGKSMAEQYGEDLNNFILHSIGMGGLFRVFVLVLRTGGKWFKCYPFFSSEPEGNPPNSIILQK